MKIKRRTSATVSVALASLLLVACAGEATPPEDETTPNGEGTSATDFDTLVEKAKEEGTVTIYSSDTEEHLLAVIDAFEAKYGITVEYVRLASAAVEQRFAEEKNAGIVSADIIQQADPTFFDLYADWFVPLEELNLPALDDYSDTYLTKYSASGAIYPAGIQYNTDLVSPEDVPTTYEELTDPKWKGKILFVNPTASPTPLSLLNLIGETYGEDWISDFGKQDLGYVDSASPGAQQVASGAYALNFPTAGGAQTSPLKSSGAPIDYVVLEPVQVGTNELSIPKDSPHPNAGALFFNFRVSYEGFEALCGSNHPEYGVPFKDGFEVPEGCIEIPGQNPVKVNYEIWHDEDANNHILDLIGY